MSSNNLTVDDLPAPPTVSVDDLPAPPTHGATGRWEDQHGASGTYPPAPGETLVNAGKYAINTATDIADMMAGFPAFAIQTAAKASSSAIGAAAGQSNAEIQQGLDSLSAKFAPYINPIATAEKGLGYTRDNTSAVEQAMAPVNAGIEKATAAGEQQGIPAGVTQQLAEQVMLFAPFVGKGVFTSGKAKVEATQKIQDAVQSGATPEQVATEILTKAKEQGIEIPKDVTKERVTENVVAATKYKPTPEELADYYGTKVAPVEQAPTLERRAEIRPAEQPANTEAPIHTQPTPEAIGGAFGQRGAVGDIAAKETPYKQVELKDGSNIIIEQSNTRPVRTPDAQQMVDLVHPPTGKEVTLYARDSEGEIVGSLELKPTAMPKVMEPIDVRVIPEMQSKGVASSLYDRAQQLGYTIKRSEYQTEAGAAFRDAYDAKKADTQTAFAKDMEAQGKVLESAAIKNGYKSVDDFAQSNPVEFAKTAQSWREQATNLPPEALANLSKKMVEDVVMKGQGFYQRGAVGDLNSGIRKAQTEQDFQVHRLFDKNGGTREDAILGYLNGERVSDAEYKTFLQKHSFFNKQMGKTDVALMAKMGVVVGGGLVGVYASPNDKLVGLLGGAAFGLGVANLPKAVTAIGQNWKQALKTGATGVAFAGVGAFVADSENPVEGALLGSAIFGLRFLKKRGAHEEDVLANTYFGNRAAGERLIKQVGDAKRELVPDKVRREQLSIIAETNKLSGLTEKEKLVVEVHQSMTKSYSDIAANEGIKMGFIENYVSHIIESVGLPQSELNQIMTKLMGEAKGTGSGTRFTKERAFATFADLEKALEGTDLRIKTKDIAEIGEIYSRSMERTIEQHKLIRGMTEALDQQGKPANWVVTDRLPGYISIPAPQMIGKFVHPDVAQAMEFVFDPRRHNQTAEALFTLNRVTKRINVFGTLFHAGSLITSYKLAGGDLSTFKSAMTEATNLYKTAGLGSRLDLLQRDGLRLSKSEDVGEGALQHVGELGDFYTNKILGTETKLGTKVLGAAERAQQATFDKFTWDYVGNGVKISTAMRLMEEFDIKKGADGKFQGLDEKAYRQAVSDHVNNMFGGVDWFKKASNAQTEAGRQLAMGLFKPSSRDWLGVAAFAPDWGISTFRAMADALPGGSTNPVTQMLARRYVLRTAVLFAVFTNTLNYVLSGHNMWDNPKYGVDVLRLDYGNGLSGQWVKHAAEYAEWITHPTKTFGNKMGFFPSLGNALLNKTEYPGGPPIEGSGTSFALKKIAPFTARSFSGDTDFNTSAARAMLSIISINTYGHTKAEKEEMKKAQKAREAEKTAQGLKKVPSGYKWVPKSQEENR